MGNMTVGKYLTTRLEQAGLKHIFGVPGDYVLHFFDDLEKSAMDMVCTCNELNAGYAADAYARMNGVGAVCVTYGVGGFSIFNAVVGSYAERLPIIVISGSPKLSDRANPHLLHHTTGDLNLQYKIYEQATVASVILVSPEQAPQQIDDTIAACLRARRPVYIEIPMDIVSMPCRQPAPITFDTTISSDKETLEEAISEAVKILAGAKKPVILAGVECHRLGEIESLKRLINHTGYPFATTMLGKSLISESHPQFVGVYYGAVGGEPGRKAVEEADVVLNLGALATDINLGMWTTKLEPAHMIIANSDKVRISHHTYDHVNLNNFIDMLIEKLPEGSFHGSKTEHPKDRLKRKFTAEKDWAITIERFYERINHFIENNNIVITDTGDSLFNVAELFIPGDAQVIAQAFYLSIGYAVPATLGAQLAQKGRRAIVFVGDGAFQMTAHQEVSTLVRHKLNPIIFLMNNDGYTIERVMKDGHYNDIQMWQYHKLPEVFNGGWGCRVHTEGELEDALLKAQKNHNILAFIEVMLDKWDCSIGLKRIGKLFKK